MLATSSVSCANSLLALVNCNQVGTIQGKLLSYDLNLKKSALADILYIYPNKRKKVSFDSKRDEILRNGLEAALSGRTSDIKGKGKDSSKNLGNGMTAQDKVEEKFLKSKH